MKLSTDQLLKLLGEQSQPVSVADIASALENSITNRTIRRLLSSLVEVEKVEKIGQSRATKYQLKQQKFSHVIFSPDSLNVLKKIRAPIYEREPCTYNESWLNEYTPNQSYYLNGYNRKKLKESTNHNMMQLPAGTYVRKIYNRLLIDLSYNSSRLEGNTYSLIETEKLVLEGHGAEGKLDAEKLMILNHKEAIRFLVNRSGEIGVTVENIRTIHYLLSNGLVASNDSGNIRNDTVRISSTTYIPLDNNERLTRLLTRIVDIANQINDPFEQSFFMLVHIAYLQAFIDVNKRTSRLAANITLVANNLAPLSFNDVDNQDYIDAVIASYELNNTAPLAELYVWSYTRSAKLYKITADAMGIDVIKAQYRTEIRQLITEVVNNTIHGEMLDSYIQKRVQETIPAKDCEKIVIDVLDELSTLKQFKIAGMGISNEQFEKWYALYHGSNK